MVDWQQMFAERTQGMRASEIREAFSLSERPDIISFAGGFPAPESFPVSAVASAMSRLFTKEPAPALQYGPTDGIYELRRLVATRMQKEGIAVEPEDILITNGSQQALDLVFKLFINPGDYVLYELPAYIGGINAAINYQARPIGIPLDDDGIDVAALASCLANMRAAGEPMPKLLYTVTNFQNPAGVCLSLERRIRLVELAREYGFIILEDNPYGDLRFEGENLPHIKTFDDEGYVFYLGSFSKSFIPGIRLGWVIADRAVIHKLGIAKQGTDLCTNSLGQKLVCEFARNGMLDTHISSLCDLYRKKRDIALAALDRHFPAGVHWTYPQGGFFTWITLPEGLDAKALLPRAVAEEHIAYVPGGAFHVDGSGKNTIRLAYSQAAESDLEEGIARLGRFLTRVVAEARAPRPDNIVPLAMDAGVVAK